MKQKRWHELRNGEEIQSFIIEHPIRLYFEGRVFVNLLKEAKEETKCVLETIKEIFLYIIAMLWIFIRVLFYPIYKVWTIYRVRETVKKSKEDDELE